MSWYLMRSFYILHSTQGWDISTNYDQKRDDIFQQIIIKRGMRYFNKSLSKKRWDISTNHYQKRDEIFQQIIIKRGMRYFNKSLSNIVNLLWPCDTIWRHRSGSTLAQVMACRLTAPSHYLTQCWLMVGSCGVLLRTNSQEIPQSSITKISLKINNVKFHKNLPGAIEIKSTLFPLMMT